MQANVSCMRPPPKSSLFLTLLSDSLKLMCLCTSYSLGILCNTAHTFIIKTNPIVDISILNLATGFFVFLTTSNFEHLESESSIISHKTIKQCACHVLYKDRLGKPVQLGSCNCSYFSIITSHYLNEPQYVSNQ